MDTLYNVMEHPPRFHKLSYKKPGAKNGLLVLFVPALL